MFSGIGDTTALNKLINDAVSAVALAGGADMASAFDVGLDSLSAGSSTKDAMEDLSARLGPICDGAIDGLAGLLVAQGTTPAAFDLQHVVLEGRGHAWLCSACCKRPAVLAAAVGRAGSSGAGARGRARAGSRRNGCMREWRARRRWRRRRRRQCLAIRPRLAECRLWALVTRVGNAVASASAPAVCGFNVSQRSC